MSISATMAVFRREFLGYFATPLAYVFIVIFLVAVGGLTFFFGGFFEQGRAELTSFFAWHPWLYLFLVPAIAMRLWAEERKAGTLELLLTLPIPLSAAVLGKFLAAWAFTGVALLLTFPIWLTVNYLGDPDNGVIVASYIGSFLMAGAYLAIGSAMSATTNSQVIAFVVSVVVCFLFIFSGTPFVLESIGAVLPALLTETLSSFSFITRFNAIMGGVIDLRDLIFFVSLIALFLFITAVIIDLRKAG